MWFCTFSYRGLFGGITREQSHAGGVGVSAVAIWEKSVPGTGTGWHTGRVEHVCTVWGSHRGILVSWNWVSGRGVLEMRQTESGWIWLNIADGFGLYSRLIEVWMGLAGFGRKGKDDTSRFIFESTILLLHRTVFSYSRCLIWQNQPKSLTFYLGHTIVDSIVPLDESFLL